LDILVNNAGGAPKFAAFDDLDDADWMDSYDLNVMSAVRFVRASVPYLTLSRNARIINISSISGLEPGGYNPHYTNTKAAVLNLTKYLANYYAQRGILVNAVCPGPVYSDSWERNVKRLASERNLSMEEARNRVDIEESGKVPLRRVGNPEDVAALALFLASDQSKWITGSCFPIDGGKMRSF
jgi:3-oxoacyl-[acyl-carrier protein] reductase